VTSQLTAAQQDIRSMQQELLFLRARVTELEAALEQAQQGGGSDGGREQQLMSHIRELESELAYAESSMAAGDEQALMAAQSRVAELERQLQEAVNTDTKVEGMLSNAGEAAKQEVVEALKSQVRELEEELARMSSMEDMEALEARMAAASAEALARAETRVQQAEAEAAKAAMEAAAAKEKLRRSVVGGDDYYIRELEAEAAQARLEATLAEVAGAARQEAVWTLSAQVQQLQNQLDDTYWEAEEEKVEMKKTMAEKTKQVEEMKSDISALETQTTSYKFIALTFTVLATAAGLVYYEVRRCSLCCCQHACCCACRSNVMAH
jgi:DNA repair exonuclease SbcCD ATPase subunit